MGVRMRVRVRKRERSRERMGLRGKENVRESVCVVKRGSRRRVLVLKEAVLKFLCLL